MQRVPGRHLARLAVIYLRQSTEQQVRQNEGSRQYQEEQREATGVRMAIRRGLETRVRFPNGIWLSGVFAAGPFEGLAMVP